MKPDACATIELFPTEQGGRKGATPSNFFGCVFVIHDKKFDGRIILKDTGAIRPGGHATAPIKFLDSVAVLEFISPGMTFELWEMGTIGKGQIIEVFNSE